MIWTDDVIVDLDAWVMFVMLVVSRALDIVQGAGVARAHDCMFSCWLEVSCSDQRTTVLRATGSM